MRADADRHQRVSVRVVMIESAYQSFAVVDGEIELELPAAASRRIRPGGVTDHRGAVAEIERAAPFRLDARGAVEKPRKLGERDRPLVIEAARRTPFTQELCDRQHERRRRGRTPGGAGITSAYG